MPTSHATSFKFVNDLRLLTIRDTRAPLFEARVVINGGWRDEADDETGAAGVLRELIPRGADSLAHELEALGVSFVRATSGTDDEGKTTSFRLFGPSPSMQLALGVMSRALAHPTLTDSAISAARALVISARRQASGNPAILAADAALRQRWSPAERDHASPSDSNLGKLTPRAVRAFHARVYHPDRVVIALVSPESDARARQAAAAFGAWSSPLSSASRRVNLQGVLPVSATSVQKIVRPGSKQVTLVLVVPLFSASPPDAACAFLMRLVLLRTLNVDLSATRGWTYGVGGLLSFGGSAGTLVVRTSVTAERAADALDAIEMHLRELRERPITPDEVALAANSIAGSLVISSESRTALAGRAVTQFRSAYPEDYWNRFRDALAKTTNADLRNYAVRALDPELIPIVVVGDSLAIQKLH